MPRLNKKFALLLILAMLATMFVGMGTASATTSNIALTVPTVSVGAARSLGTIQISETTIGAIQAGQQIVVTLPSGSNYSAAPADAGRDAYLALPALVGQLNTPNGVQDGDISIDAASTNRVLVLNVGNRTYAANPAVINLLFNSVVGAYDSRVNITAGAADYKVNILDTSGAVTSGDVINAHVAVGGTTAYALGTPTRTQGANRTLGPLRIIENQIGALAAGTATSNTISITLPEGITFTGADINPAGGFAVGDIGGPVISTASSGLSKATFWVNTPSVGNAGVIDITPTVTIDLTAQKGDISATIGGTNPFITPGTVVVGKYGEYGITATCDNPTNIYAGRTDVKIGSLVLHENVPATLVQDRTVNLELPEGCRWVQIPVPVTTKSSTRLTNGATLAGSNNRIASYTVQQGAGVASDIEFRQGTISVPANFPAGDLNVTFGGTAGALADDMSKITVKVATIVAPVTLAGATPSPTVIIGKQNQNGDSFDIVEAGVGAISARIRNTQTELIISCPAGATFTELPDISVTGDLRVDLINTKLSGDNSAIIVPITTSSVTTASTISFKNVKYTLDRTVPEGAMKLDVTGSAVDWWPVYYGVAPFLNYTVAASGQVANVTTPAPVEENKKASFVIGESKYTLEGAEVTMDVAPYIKDSRTFLPLAYVAQALGVSDSNIIWDEANQTVTLMKGDKVIQVKVGSKIMLINGASITLDAAPEISSDRTCLPIALVAQAFGESATWDAATQTVTIE